jgi:hypothetical protein
MPPHIHVMKSSGNGIRKTDVQTVRIIACGVFRPCLEQLGLAERFPNLRITYLQSNLHIHPEEIREHLLREFDASQKRNERVICLYGECFKGMDLFCNEKGVPKIQGSHCYEILLGTDNFRKITDDNPKSYFLEKDLRLVYVRQPSDPDLMPDVRKIAGFLGLSVIILDADYSNLEKELVKLIGPGR